MRPAGSAVRSWSRRAVLAAVLTSGALVVPSESATAAVECRAGTTRYIDTPAYALARLAVGRSWSLATGQGVTVAVVDSGVEDGNAHLEDAVLPGKSFVPGDDDSTGRTDVWAHGTAIAGIIAARPVTDSAVVGMAPNAKILPVRVFVQEAVEGSTPVPEGQRPDTARMADGIRWAAEQGADVINVSMSTSANDAGLRSAVRFAVSRDAVIVASAGNRVAEGERDGLRYPAALPGVIGVAASDESDQVTDFSISGPQVDAHAPGQNILTTFLGNGDCLIGTDHPYSSYAAGYVSALAALLRERYPDASAEEIAYRIMASADRPRRDERDDVRGWGMISPYEALTMTIDTTRPGPPVPGAETQQTPAVDKSVPPITAAPNPLAPARQELLWWVLFGGGFVALAFLLRPWVGPMLRRLSR